MTRLIPAYLQQTYWRMICKDFISRSVQTEEKGVQTTPDENGKEGQEKETDAVNDNIVKHEESEIHEDNPNKTGTAGQPTSPVWRLTASNQLVSIFSTGSPKWPFINDVSPRYHALNETRERRFCMQIKIQTIWLSTFSKVCH